MPETLNQLDFTNWTDVQLRSEYDRVKKIISDAEDLEKLHRSAERHNLSASSEFSYFSEEKYVAEHDDEYRHARDVLKRYIEGTILARAEQRNPPFKIGDAVEVIKPTRPVYCWYCDEGDIKSIGRQFGVRAHCFDQRYGWIMLMNGYSDFESYVATDFKLCNSENKKPDQ